ncbi:host specificity factor TipJ family phage tail protein [Pseudomonas sp.]|uniref:host specificity factor TipJ family phage tail protein n=1 Tax=Pseudomonas sp. TaxID=306 RepID=UPI002583FE5D|nr:host specificity factor TipJ family phage tail protein [Pseudomonas sp.]
MIEIRYHSHPLAAAEVLHVESLALWLLDQPRDTPLGLYAGGKQLTDPDSVLAATGPITAVREPGVEAITWAAVQSVLIQAAAALALSYVLGALFAPGAAAAREDNRTTKSPNNQLGSRDNQVRVLERVEDIFGRVKSVPSLMMPSYFKYVNHRQVEYGYYCVGRGYYDVTELRDGDTLISDFSRASAAVYAPFTSPGHGSPQLQIGPAITVHLLTAQRNEQVDGITLEPLNKLQILGEQTWDLDGSTLRLTQKTGYPGIGTIAEPGVTLTYTGATGGYTPEQSVSFVFVGDFKVQATYITDLVVGDKFEVLDDGTWREYTVLSKPAADQAEVSPTWFLGSATLQTRRAAAPVSFTAEIATVGELFVTLTGVSFPTATGATGTAIVQNGVTSEWTSWMTSNSQTATGAWFNITAVAGLYSDAGKGQNPLTIAYQFEVQRLDGSDTCVINSSLTGQGQDMRAETVEFALPWVGPFRARARRVTPYDSGFEGAIVDEIKWSDLYAVSRVDRADFGNKTTVQTVMYATPRATSVRSRQLNCLAARKLPTFNGTAWSGAFDATGRHVSGTISATSRASDIIGNMVMDRYIGNRPISDADMAQIYATQLQIETWRPDCGEFNYTFDSKDSSLEDMIGAVASAVFCTAFRQAGKIRLFFNRPQTQAQTLFSHRNKKPNAETFTRSFRNDSDYDGVELTYRDRLSTQAEKIRLPQDGRARHYKTLDIVGVTNYEQAWMHANRQYNQLLNQRIVVDTEVTQIGRLVAPGALVDIVDNTRFQSYDGNVIGQDGLTLRLSQPVVVEATSSIVLMRRDGSIESIPVTAGRDQFHVVLARYPSQPLVTQLTADGGEPTEFSVASNDRRKAQTMLVKGVSRSDGEYVKITAVNYTDAYYSADYQPIPPRESVINAT